MALLETRLSKDHKYLIVSAKKVSKDIEDLKVHVHEACDHTTKGVNLQVTVWGQECLARDCGEEYAKWFSTVLGGDEKLRLVHVLKADKYNRPSNEGGVVSAAVPGSCSATQLAHAIIPDPLQRSRIAQRSRTSV